MRTLKPCLSLVLALQVILLLPTAHAMNMPSYDLDSLVYMSTDIVIANLSEDLQHKFTATVTETLYGSLNPGEKLDTLTPFLTFFDPMKDGMRVVLFLDRRPHKYDFFHSDAAKSPFAIAPSGVYLIDEYQHVHTYYQMNNPGPYEAQGYRDFPHRSVSTKEQDLAMPSLDEMRGKIATSLVSVQTIRPLLDKAATRDDIANLIRLIDTRSTNREDCNLRTADAITERALYQIRSLNDPELLLRAGTLASNWESALSFISPSSEMRLSQAEEKQFTASRVKFLLYTLSDPKQDVSLRTEAVQFFLDIYGFRNKKENIPTTKIPIDNPWLTSYALELTSTAKAIFDDDSQNAHLRSLCLQLLPLDQPAIAADAWQVYTRAQTDELRYVIEDEFLKVSDTLFEGLHASGGDAASIVTVETLGGCSWIAPDSIVFRASYHERKDIGDKWRLELDEHPVLTNLRTKQRFVLRHISVVGGWSGGESGQSEFQLDDLTGIPPGKYSLAYEINHSGKILSNGYSVAVAINETAKGKELSVIPLSK